MGLAGDRGPAGVKGMKGATGDQGMKGEQGAKGEPVSVVISHVCINQPSLSESHRFRQHLLNGTMVLPCFSGDVSIL